MAYMSGIGNGRVGELGFLEVYHTCLARIYEHLVKEYMSAERLASFRASRAPCVVGCVPVGGGEENTECGDDVDRVLPLGIQEPGSRVCSLSVLTCRCLLFHSVTVDGRFVLFCILSARA